MQEIMVKELLKQRELLIQEIIKQRGSSPKIFLEVGRIDGLLKNIAKII